MATTSEPLSDASFADTCERHLRPLRALLLQLAGSLQSADEIAQEVLLEAAAHRLDYDPRTPFAPWLFDWAWRRWPSERHRRGLPVGRLDPSCQDCSTELFPPDLYGDETWSEERRVMREAMRALPVEDRHLLIAWLHEQRPATEIAEELNRSVDWLQQRLVGIRVELRRHMAQQLQDERNG